ncbi:hypothetical protein [Pyxidicoccus sp. MSG2]|uniref:hypothetical protein n=1 Tax=Pyxidicoccus sp. MSG2 TaxID=2996790 RepID=UPI00226E5D15|nr:hypothetical protein [Pyxidicoccus sp. MSG2]MCY1015800.1 hypothetical protein [Pyxidicoccus sp. MSG2]
MRWLAVLMWMLACDALAATVTVSAAGARGEPHPELSRAVASALLAQGTSVAIMGEGGKCDPPCQRLRVELDAEGGVSIQAELGTLRASRHLEHVAGASTVELARAIALEGQDLLTQLGEPPRPVPRKAPVGAPRRAAEPVASAKASAAQSACDGPVQTAALPVGPAPVEPVPIERMPLPPAPAPAPIEVPRLEVTAPSPAPRSWLSFGARGLVHSFPSTHLVMAGAALGARAELVRGLDVRLSLAATVPTIDDSGPLRVRLHTTSGSALFAAQLGSLPLWIGGGAELVFLAVDRPVPDFDTLEAESVGGLLGVETRLRLARATAVLGVQGAWHPFGSRAELDRTTAFVYPSFGASVLAGLEVDVF